MGRCGGRVFGAKTNGAGSTRGKRACPAPWGTCMHACVHERLLHAGGSMTMHDIPRRVVPCPRGQRDFSPCGGRVFGAKTNGAGSTRSKQACSVIWREMHDTAVMRRCTAYCDSPAASASSLLGVPSVRCSHIAPQGSPHVTKRARGVVEEARLFDVVCRGEGGLKVSSRHEEGARGG